jgi:hypothetical protein
MEPNSAVPIQELMSPEQEFAQLREQFHVRLQREAARLGQLMAALPGGNVNSVKVLEEIGMFAHRLRGAALVFEYRAIGDAAKALELAVAPDPHGQRADWLIVSTMQALATELAEETGRQATVPGASPPTVQRVVK